MVLSDRAARLDQSGLVGIWYFVSVQDVRGGRIRNPSGGLAKRNELTSTDGEALFTTVI